MFQFPSEDVNSIITMVTKVVIATSFSLFQGQDEAPIEIINNQSHLYPMKIEFHKLEKELCLRPLFFSFRFLCILVTTSEIFPEYWIR